MTYTISKYEAKDPALDFLKKLPQVKPILEWLEASDICWRKVASTVSFKAELELSKSDAAVLVDRLNRSVHAKSGKPVFVRRQERKGTGRRSRVFYVISTSLLAFARSLFVHHDECQLKEGVEEYLRQVIPAGWREEEIGEFQSGRDFLEWLTRERLVVRILARRDFLFMNPRSETFCENLRIFCQEILSVSDQGFPVIPNIKFNEGTFVKVPSIIEPGNFRLGISENRLQGLFVIKRLTGQSVSIFCARERVARKVLPLYVVKPNNLNGLSKLVADFNDVNLPFKIISGCAIVLRSDLVELTYMTCASRPCLSYYSAASGYEAPRARNSHAMIVEKLDGCFISETSDEGLESPKAVDYPTAVEFLQSVSGDYKITDNQFAGDLKDYVRTEHLTSRDISHLRDVWIEKLSLHRVGSISLTGVNFLSIDLIIDRNIDLCNYDIRGDENERLTISRAYLEGIYNILKITTGCCRVLICVGEALPDRQLVYGLISNNHQALCECLRGLGISISYLEDLLIVSHEELISTAYHARAGVSTSQPDDMLLASGDPMDPGDSPSSAQF